VNVPLFGIRVFGEGIKDLKMKSSGSAIWALNTLISVLMRGRARTDRRDNVKIESETKQGHRELQKLQEQ
jgi:hypothetical protein